MKKLMLFDSNIATRLLVCTWL